MKRIVLILSLSLLLIGCQTTQPKPQQRSFDDVIKNLPKTPGYHYDPQGKEEFIFHEKIESLQKYGYSYVCKNTKTVTCQSISYYRYFGMRGYFDTETPVKKDSSGHEFYPVTLRNGQKFYLVSLTKYGGKYGSSSPIISYEEYLKLKEFQSEPLISGSSINIIKIKMQYNSKWYELSNGQTIPAIQLKRIRNICEKFGDKPEMAELLLNMRIRKDEVDFKYFVSSDTNSLKSPAQLYIGFDDNNIWLRFKVEYKDNDWLFVHSYKIAADDYRWQSPNLTFKRDHSSGQVWEWQDVLAGNKEIERAMALANANKAIIRFQGSKYYSDKELNEDQQKSIKQIIKLYQLMKEYS